MLASSSGSATESLIHQPVSHEYQKEQFPYSIPLIHCRVALSTGVLHLTISHMFAPSSLIWLVFTLNYWNFDCEMPQVCINTKRYGGTQGFSPFLNSPNSDS